MVKCTKRQIRQLKTALHWKIPEKQRERIRMVLLRAVLPSGGTQHGPGFRARHRAVSF